MKPVSAKITNGLQIGSRVKCADNTGATEVEIIAIKGYKGVRRRRGSAGVGGVVITAVKKGNPKMKHQVVPCVIIRQRREYRRKNGMRIKFEDNAVIVVNEKGETKGTRIKGPVAKEAIERFSQIGKVASMVI